MRTLRLLGAAALLGALARPAPCAVLARVEGVVETRAAPGLDWDLVLSTSPRRVDLGAEIRTGAGASAVLALDAGAVIALGPSTEASLEGSTARPIVALARGALRANFGKEVPAQPRLAVPAGVVVSRAPSTVARLETAGASRAVVEAARGAVAVEDARGGRLILRAGERLTLEPRGAGEPDAAPGEAGLERERWRLRARRELSLERAREAVLVAAARDARFLELREGRALMDSSGRRVRVERYVVRPAGDALRLVTLSSRGGDFSAFSLLGTFDRSLPTELSSVFAALPGKADAVPSFVMTAYETLRTNGVDSVVERAQGGHAVDLNANAVPGDDVAALYDALRGRYESTTGRAVFRTLYDRYGLYVNGALKRGWRGTNVQSYDAAEAVPSAASGLDPITGAAAAVFAVSRSETYPDAGLERRLVYESYGDGSFLEWDLRSTEADGSLAPRAGDRTLRTLGFNLEQSIRASEFGGRRIELFVPAQIPAAAGLLP